MDLKTSPYLQKLVSSLCISQCLFISFDFLLFFSMRTKQDSKQVSGRTGAGKTRLESTLNSKNTSVNLNWSLWRYVGRLVWEQSLSMRKVSCKNLRFLLRNYRHILKSLQENSFPIMDGCFVLPIYKSRSSPLHFCDFSDDDIKMLKNFMSVFRTRSEIIFSLSSRPCCSRITW